TCWRRAASRCSARSRRSGGWRFSWAGDFLSWLPYFEFVRSHTLNTLNTKDTKGTKGTKDDAAERYIDFKPSPSGAPISFIYTRSIAASAAQDRSGKDLVHGPRVGRSFESVSFPVSSRRHARSRRSA